MAERPARARLHLTGRLSVVLGLLALVPVAIFAGVLLVIYFSEPVGASKAKVDHDLLAAGAWAAAAVTVAAAVVAFAIARRMAVPLGSLTDAARAMALGRPDVQVDPVPASPLFGELSTAFNVMAGTLERQDRLRRRLVADVAHELRTPIAILQGWVEAMLEGVTEPTHANLSSLLDETLRLSRIVRDLEVLSASDVAALTMDFDRVDLGEVVEAAAASLDARAAHAGLSLVREIRPAHVKGDQERLHQVVVNLLLNAIKFTPPGGRVTVSVGTVEHGVQLAVTDTGVGVPPDELPNIFERFWRGRAAAGMAGSGIGLAVVAGLVEAQGGTVNVQSQVGKGSRFIVSLPTA